MALITCPECRNEISDSANICVHCGFPIPKVESIKLTPSSSEKFEEYAEMRSDTTEQGAEQDVEVSKDKSNISNVSFWSFNAAKILLVLVILALSLSIFSVYNSTTISAMEYRMDLLNDYIEIIDQRLLLTNLGVEISEGVVSDKVVVQKASFYISDADAISATIDLRPQPSYYNKFLGHGDFDLTDRELRNMIKEIVDEILDYSSSSIVLLKGQSNLSIESGTIYITANNYDVAEYTDGIIILAGE